MRHTKTKEECDEKKKDIQGGASEDIQATKVSPISSRHRVLQSAV